MNLLNYFSLDKHMQQICSLKTQRVMVKTTLEASIKCAGIQMLDQGDYQKTRLTISIVCNFNHEMSLTLTHWAFNSSCPPNIFPFYYITLTGRAAGRRIFIEVSCLCIWNSSRKFNRGKDILYHVFTAYLRMSQNSVEEKQKQHI